MQRLSEEFELIALENYEFENGQKIITKGTILNVQLMPIPI